MLFGNGSSGVLTGGELSHSVKNCGLASLEQSWHSANLTYLLAAANAPFTSPLYSQERASDEAGAADGSTPPQTQSAGSLSWSGAMERCTRATKAGSSTTLPSAV